ncbi:MAG: PspC domain-containing protein [Clostridiales bacterium]|jgi:phage shock protein PspC (stress-responsive transcriptional regulator)|nr:PspC domain-containing protein [Clostridiales bacterium]
MKKRVYLSTENKIIGGVCGGFGEYFGIDPTFMRLIVVIIMMMTAIIPICVLYAVCYAIIPHKPDDLGGWENKGNGN